MRLRLLGVPLALAAAFVVPGGAAGVAAAAATGPLPAGTVQTWGANNLGQQGGNGLTGIVEIAGGREHTLALTSGGVVLAWGDNSEGAVGDGTTVGKRLKPVPVTGLTGQPAVRQVVAGHYSSFALLTDGTARAWGYGVSGQLGDGSFVTRRSPVTVRLTGISQIAGGRDHTLALSNGHVFAWGDNTYGEIGDGTTTKRALPKQVTFPAGVTIVDVAAGRNHSLAVASDGSLWAWGRNNFGQVGDHTRTNRLRPVRLTGVPAVADVQAGAYHTLALTTTGTVWAWGRGGDGATGLGITTNTTVPTAITGLAGITAIGCGRDDSLAIQSDGTLLAWGLNNVKQLGDGTTTSRLTPVVVTGVSDVEALAPGADYTAVLIAPPPPTG
jgi:alpha-tubulin suppressor-like RCC1 family protein